MIKLLGRGFTISQSAVKGHLGLTPVVAELVL
jgi:hypothetical protein